ncbi:MAG: class I SAM-dependent methyltransferase [Gammaproteobacteria bacterium]
MTEHDDAALARWDAYWQHGFLTSCADAFDGNYGGSIARFWHDQFAALEREAVVLDVCTGNGAVAALAAQHGLDHDLALRVVGVDLAAIEPSRALASQTELLERIEFFPRTSAAATPLDDACVALACGQYALEYTPLKDTVRELARVIRPGGRARFILHHSDSVILRTTAGELAHRPLLTGSDTLLDAAEALAQCVAQATTPAARQALAHDPHAEACRQRLNDLAATVTQRARSSEQPEILHIALNYAKNGYSATLSQSFEAGRTILDRGRAEIDANFARLDDLSAAALDASGIEALRSDFARQGFDVAPARPFEHEGSLIGWTLSADRITT